MINIGVIGYGYWGPNVARNFHACAGARLTSISEISEKRLALARSHYPSIKASADYHDLVRSEDVDVVAVVTPVSTHYQLAREALLAGKHVFVEKPFTATSGQARKLIDLAERKGLRIMVDHTFLFTGAVRKMREIIDSGEMGNLLFYDSVRVNLGLFQHDVNVNWDLAPHDLSIMNYLIKDKPVSVSAYGSVHYPGGHEDVAYISLQFERPSFIAHFHVNWLSPVKIRSTLISGDKKMLVWDDISSDEKIKVYDRGVAFDGKNGMNGKNGQNGIHKLLVSYRSGDIHIPKLENIEALKAEVEYYINCLERNERPFNDGQAGLEVVRILEAVDHSMKNGGRKIAL
jgi:predicted dehydrogenase